MLLVFGLQWLRKAILRASGLKALHDEDAIYAAEVAQLRADGEQPTHDWYAFTVAFKGVFLEGLEVAFIIVTFGGTQHNVGLAAIGAAAAFVVVLVAGVIVHAPLTRVPENTLKFGVGVMLDRRSGSSGRPKAPASRGPAPTCRCSASSRSSW